MRNQPFPRVNGSTTRAATGSQRADPEPSLWWYSTDDSSRCRLGAHLPSMAYVSRA